MRYKVKTRSRFTVKKAITTKERSFTIFNWKNEKLATYPQTQPSNIVIQWAKRKYGRGHSVYFRHSERMVEF